MNTRQNVNILCRCTYKYMCVYSYFYISTYSFYIWSHFSFTCYLFWAVQLMSTPKPYASSYKFYGTVKFKLSASMKGAFFSYRVLQLYIEGHALVKPLVLLIVFSWILELHWHCVRALQMRRTLEYLMYVTALLWKQILKAHNISFWETGMSWNWRHSNHPDRLTLT